MKLKTMASYALGLNTITAIKKSATDLLWNKSSQYGWEMLRDSARQIRGGAAKPQAEESFESACARLGVDEVALLVRLESLRLQELVMRSFGYVALLSSLVAGWFAESFFWFVLLIFQCLAIAGMFFVSSMAKGFRAWQIERRALLTFSDFIKDGGLVRMFIGGRSAG